MKRYQVTFEFADTISEAMAVISRYNANATRWQRKKYPAHYTSWSSTDGSEEKFVVWLSR